MMHPAPSTTKPLPPASRRPWVSPAGCPLSAITPTATTDRAQ